MRKILAVLMVVAVVGGCAAMQSAQDYACKNGDVIKARIRAALQIAQVGYPLVIQLAGKTSDPNVHYKISLLDAALDLLGQLAYNIACPDLLELNQAETALIQAQDAKAELELK